MRADAYSVPRDSICQRGCVVLLGFHFDVRATGAKHSSTGHPPRHARPIIELESTSLAALFPARPSSAPPVVPSSFSLRLLSVSLTLLLAEIARDAFAIWNGGHYLHG